MSDVQTKVGLTFGSSGASSVASDIGSIYRALREGKTTVKEANSAIKEYTGTIYTQRRALAIIRADYRNNNAALLESMKAMRSAARIGRTMVNVFQTYTLMQIRMADTQRDVRSTEEDLLRIQGLRARAERALGANSVYAQDLMEKERQLTEKLNQERQDLTRVQRDNTMGYVSMGISMLDIIPNIVSTYTHIKLTKAILGESWELTALGKLSTALNARIAESAALTAAIAAIPTALTIGVSFTLGALPAAGLSAIELSGGPKTPTPMSGLTSDELGLTKEELESGMTYADKYGEWREENQNQELSAMGLIEQFFKSLKGSAYTGYEEKKQEAPIITLYQTNNIRTADDKTTVRKIADKTAKIIGDRVMR